MKTIQEIERRFIVRSIDPDVRLSPSSEIEQGYFETRPDCSARVRLTDGTKPELTKKTGSGISRPEATEDDVTVASARFLLDPRIVDIIRKTRYVRDDWEIDFYHGPLNGLVKAELEMESIDFPLVRPPWIHDWFEVTDSVTDRLLARLSRDLEDSMSDRPIIDLLPKRIPHIVVTGGPCAGKSTAMAALRGEIGDLVHCVPEVATIVIEQVGVRPPVRDPVGMRKFQRTLYRVQRGFETISDLQALQDGKRALLTDRGTIDGSAYMDGGHDEFEKVCRTSVLHEYGQYDLVICLGVPPKHVYDANKHNNPARKEGYKQAVKLGERIIGAWSKHPNFHLVDGKSWQEKLDAIRAIIGSFLSKH
jgi:CYTH domain-containing protein/predicted ATPase